MKFYQFGAINLNADEIESYWKHEDEVKIELKSGKVYKVKCLDESEKGGYVATVNASRLFDKVSRELSAMK